MPGGEVTEQDSIMGVVKKRLGTPNMSPYVLHRLDRDTSGVLLFGKFAKDRAALEAIFGDPRTQKKYLALVVGVPGGRSISKKLKSRKGTEEIPAYTSYKILQIFKGRGAPLVTLVEAEIHTGRKHQIRQHFASIGHPIVGDARYGNPEFNRKFRMRFRLGRHFLHAAILKFFHPLLKKEVEVLARLPADLEVMIGRLPTK